MEVELMGMINSSVTLDNLSPTDMPFIYRFDRSIFSPYVYYDGMFFCELNVYAMEILGLEDPRFNIVKNTEALKIDFDIMAMYKKEAAKINTLIELPRGYVRAFGMINERIGLATYIERFKIIPDDQKYDAFIEVYTRAESGFELLEPIYHEIFSYAHLSKQRLDRLQGLALRYEDGEKFKIYHGAKLEELYNPNDLYSWTLSKKIADFFAHRYGTPGEIWVREISVEEAIDYLEDRSEEEILYDYKK